MQTHVLDSSIFVSFILLIMMKVNENVKVMSIQKKLFAKRFLYKLFLVSKKLLKRELLKQKLIDIKKLVNNIT